MKNIFSTIILFILLILISCTKDKEASLHRYVVLSPEIAEIIYFLGVSDRIVGVTYECDYPEQLKNISSVGNFGSYSLEKILSLNPSIVFTTSLEQNEITQQLRRLNIETYQFYPSSIADLLGTIKEIGEIVDKVDVADSLATYIESEINLLSVSNINGPKVYIEIYGNPIMSADNSSFLGQLLIYAGFQNIFPKLIRDYAMVNPEDVVINNPDIIIITYPGVSADDVINRKGWNQINAVINNKIFTVEHVDPDIILRATPRNIEGLKILRNLMDL